MDQKNGLIKAKSYIPQSLFAIAIGLFLIIWPDVALTYVVIAIGIALGLSGVISVGSYFQQKKEGISSSTLLINGIIILLFGIILISTPLFFVNFLMLLLGVLLSIGALSQLWALIKVRKVEKMVPGILFILPSLLLIAGLLVLFNPFGSAKLITIIFGVSAIVFGAIQLYNTSVINSYLKKNN